MQPLASIPSPPYGVVHLGPLPLRAYALMIILGVVVAVWLGERRWVPRGGTAGAVVDIAVWAVPFGLVGARLYHVITDHQRYFGAGQHPVDALKIWTGGLGIWGGVALGTLGAYIGCRRRGISLRVFADAVAPGIALAQAIGRWGNWFNQELYGRPLHTFWALSIDREHRPLLPDGTPDPKYADIATYHPTFLYESLWCVGVAVLVIWAEKRFRLTFGRTFALYVAAYTVGRAWIESLRIDAAHHILGLRLNDWTSLIVFLAAVAYLYAYRDRGPDPESAYGTAEPAAAPTAEDAPDTATASTGEPSAETDDAEPESRTAGDEEPVTEADEDEARKEPEAEEVEAQGEPDADDAEARREPEAEEVEAQEESEADGVEAEGEPEIDDAEAESQTEGDEEPVAEADEDDAHKEPEAEPVAQADTDGDDGDAADEPSAESNGARAAADQSEAATRGSGP